MSDSKSSGSLSKGDLISFIALLLMGVILFFGMNFITMGDLIPSIVVAIVIVVLMIVFVFLAAYAKAQDRNQSKWKIVEYVMLGLYIVALIPCYVFAAKFFDIQFDKDNVIKQVNIETDNLDRMFSDYSRKCESRASAFQIELESMLTTPEGRMRLSRVLDIKDSASINKEMISQAAQSFSKSLKGADFKALEAEKKNLVNKSESNFNNWNIMLIPHYAHELGNATDRYAAELERIYGKSHNNIERNIPEFDTSIYLKESVVLKQFRSTDNFSIIGLVVVIFLGLLGLVKYLLGDRSLVIPMRQGDASVIEEDGGITC